MNIKVITAVIFCSNPCFAVGPTVLGSEPFIPDEQYLAQERQQVEMWETNLGLAKAMPDKEKIDFLILGLVNMGVRSSRDNPPENLVNIYEAIQNELTSIPGHAKYFGDQIRESHARNPAYTGGWEYSYKPLRNRIFRFYFPSLKTPETILELGSFLYDEKDLEYENEPGKLPKDYNLQANCDLALNSLKRMGLRPSLGTVWSGRPLNEHHYDLIAWQAWWKKVKAGKLAFSFEGKDVEYRFKPDGSWIEGPLGTTSPSDRATNSASGSLRPYKRNAPSEENYSATQPLKRDDSPVFSRWIAGSILLVLIAAGFVLRKRVGRS